MIPPLYTLEGLRSGQYKGVKTLKLSCDLAEFPREILDLAASLEILDLSGNRRLSTLPREIRSLHKLKIAFFSNCSFASFPSALSQCPNLEMVAFKSNRMTAIPENSLPRRLRWLILTDNEIREIPRDIGKCERLQKCMLAGNGLKSLPDEMRHCTRLGLLRLSVNQIVNLPPWLFEMPELAFLSFAGNPCSVSCCGPEDGSSVNDDLQSISSSDLTIQHLLGEGASGFISKAIWNRADREKGEVEVEEVAVAIKLFKGALTSDGAPSDEMDASIAAGRHGNLISPLGRLTGLGKGKRGLALELVPEQYVNLGLPPNFDTCTRDVFPDDMSISVDACKSILLGVAGAAEHLHARKVGHGDLYAHNILFDGETGHALLGDFGAATVYGMINGGGIEALEKIEVRAFGHLIQDLLGLVVLGVGASESEKGELVLLEVLTALQALCTGRIVGDRPPFRVVREILEGLSA